MGNRYTFYSDRVLSRIFLNPGFDAVIQEVVLNSERDIFYCQSEGRPFMFRGDKISTIFRGRRKLNSLSLIEIAELADFLNVPQDELRELRDLELTYLGEN